MQKNYLLIFLMYTLIHTRPYFSHTSSYWLSLNVKLFVTWWWFSWYIGIMGKHNWLLRKVTKGSESKRNDSTLWSGYIPCSMLKFVSCNKGYTVPHNKIKRLFEYFLSWKVHVKWHKYHAFLVCFLSNPEFWFKNFNASKDTFVYPYYPSTLLSTHDLFIC